MAFNKVLALFLLLLMMAYPVYSWSITFTEDLSLKKSVIDVVDKIIQRGQGKIGNFDLRRFRNELNDVKFLIAPNFLIGTENRTGAINLPESKMVIFSGAGAKNLSYTRLLLLAIHEGFGALGYQDDNDYSLSIGLLLVSGLPNIDDIACNPLFDGFSHIKINKKNRMYQIASNGGGSTGVGGGGDPYAAELKFDITINAQVWLKSKAKISDDSKKKFLKKIAEMKIESSWIESFSQKTGRFDCLILASDYSKITYHPMCENNLSLEETYDFQKEMFNKIYSSIK